MPNIKLNRNELINLINESVRSILKELDWKTYQNAANKDYNHIRGKEFSKAARDNFNKKYSYDDNNGNSVQLRNYSKNDNYLNVNSHYNDDSSFRTKKDFLFTSKPSTDHSNGEFYNRYTTDSSSVSPYPHTMDKRHARKIAKAYDDFHNYKNGNLKYVNGKGWEEPQNPTDFHQFLKY